MTNKAKMARKMLSSHGSVMSTLTGLVRKGEKRRPTKKDVLNEHEQHEDHSVRLYRGEE